MSLNKKDGAIIVLSSPSGAGKTTLVKKLAKNKNFKISVSYTTRVPRISENNGEDYYFVSKNDFKKLIENNELLEYANVFNNFYGSSKKRVFNILDNGDSVLFDIDWQGTNQIKEKNLEYKILTIFILPPSKKILLNRLSERENKNQHFISERMKNFERDVLHWNDYDFVVINDELNTCLTSIIKFIENKLNNRSYNYDKEKIKTHIKSLIN